MKQDKLIFSKDGRASVRLEGRLNVLHLQGTDMEMAAQHAELLQQQAAHGLLPFMAGYLVGHVKHQKKGLERLVTKAVVEGLCRHVAKHMPMGQLRAFYTLAKGIGMTPGQAEVALGSADTLLILFAGASSTAKWAMNAGLARAMPFACSGIVVSPGASANGHLLHGRNMDYDGLGVWDNNHTVAFLKPQTSQPYGFISTAGIHTAALTGFNDSGIFAAVNTSPTRDCSWRGEPLFAVMERMVRNARDLDDAISILSGSRIASGYNVHISHGPSGRSAVVEIAYSKMAVRYPEHGILLTTNHYITDKMAMTMPEIPLVDLRNSNSRLKRLQQLFQDAGDIDQTFIANALRDRTDPVSNTEHPLGDVVCNYMNLSSIVADVTDGKLWVASGNAPVALSNYIGFDIYKEWQEFDRVPSYNIETIKGPEKADGLRCTRLFQDAHKAITHHGDPALGFEYILEALRLCPDEPHLMLTGAMIALSIEKPEVAARLANTYLLRVPETDARRFRAHMVLAWIAELKNDTKTAGKEMQAAMALANDDATRFEVNWWMRRKPLDKRGLRNFHVDLFSGRRLMF